MTAEQLEPYLLGNWCVVPEPENSSAEFIASLKTDEFSLIISKHRNQPTVFDVNVIIGNFIPITLIYQSIEKLSNKEMLDNLYSLVLKDCINSSMAQFICAKQNGMRVH